MGIEFSRRLAVVGGILAPLGDTLRRWGTWREWPPDLLDDYVMGALLLYGAWRVGRDVRSGRPFLAAAWGLACGFGYYSFFGQLRAILSRQPDPAPVASEWVPLIKGVAWGLAIFCLFLTLRRLPEEAAQTGGAEAMERSAGRVVR